MPIIFAVGHHISGFIARSDSLKAMDGVRAAVCQLEQRFAFLPISDDMVDPDEPSSHFQCFSVLTQSLTEWAIARSSEYPIVYIETDYFGGTGAQAAVVWKDGRISVGPLETRNDDNSPRTSLRDSAINQCLRFLGADCVGHIDEFAAVGLARHRSNEGWVTSGK